MTLARRREASLFRCLTRGSISVAVVILLASSVACRGPKSAAGFRLPDGDSVIGQRVFVDNSCHSCHTVVGVELGEPITRGPVDVRLGGQTTRVRTYGELVTSIINPSHRLAPLPGADITNEDGTSRMPSFNDTLTVQQLIDLVAFLQEHYEVVPPAYEYHPYTYGP